MKQKSTLFKKFEHYDVPFSIKRESNEYLYLDENITGNLKININIFHLYII